MSVRLKVPFAATVAVACAVALAACSGQGASTTASSSAAASSSASSASTASSASASPSSSAGTGTSAAAGTTATIDLDYNAGTGYEWTYTADPEGIVELVGADTEDLAEGGVTGGPLQDRYTFRAVAPGEVALTFDLTRGRGTDGEPAETQVYAFTVTDDLELILNPYKSDFTNEPTIG